MFSRLLYGGRSTLILAGLAALVTYVVGGTIGLVAGFNRSKIDPILMRSIDILLSVPALLVILLLVTGFGSGSPVLVLATSLVLMPGVARIVRSATLEVSTRGYVEAAIARGEPTRALLLREVLPNISGVVTADLGLRFTLVDHPDRERELPRRRHPASDCGLGTDDLREPGRDRQQPDGHRRTLGGARHAYYRREPRGRRLRPTARPIKWIRMTSSSESVLRLEGVRVGVRKGPTVIDEVTLDLRRGEIVCLVGESGSGKTTTALSAFGYCAPELSISAGEIAVDGEVAMLTKFRWNSLHDSVHAAE